MKAKLHHCARQLGALGHPARLGILRHVAQGGSEGSTLTELQQKLDVPLTTLSHHVERLASAALLAARREGKCVRYTANYEAIRTLTEFLWEDCCKRGRGASKGA